MNASKVLAVVALTGGALLLSACAPETGAQPAQVVSQGRGLPKQVRAVQFSANASDARPAAYWTDAKRKSITLVTYGSGSCPAVPTAVNVLSATKVLLPLKKYDGACTADLGPYTTVLNLPQRVARDKAVTLTLNASDNSQFDTNLRLQPNPTLPELASR